MVLVAAFTCSAAVVALAVAAESSSLLRPLKLRRGLRDLRLRLREELRLDEDEYFFREASFFLYITAFAENET